MDEDEDAECNTGADENEDDEEEKTMQCNNKLSDDEDMDRDDEQEEKMQCYKELYHGRNVKSQFKINRKKVLFFYDWNNMFVCKIFTRKDPLKFPLWKNITGLIWCTKNITAPQQIVLEKCFSMTR